MLNLILYVFIGGLVGVIINYLADVLPKTRRFSRPVCSNCSTPYSLKGYLFSFKCEHCGNSPSKRSFIVFIVSIVISVLVAVFPFGGLSYWLTIPLLVYLGTIIVIDIEYHVILTETSWFGLILLLIYGICMQGMLKTVLGGAAGFAIMIAFYYFGIFFSRLLGKIRKQEIEEVALGFGDVYVSTFLGFLAGWPTIVGALIIGILASGVFSLFFILFQMIRKKYQAFTAIPYAPFLILGMIATFYIQ